MSHRPTQRPAISLTTLDEKKALGEPIVMVTAYDFPSAQIADEAGVDVVLVGDTAAMVVLGHDATTPVGMDEMLMLAAAFAPSSEPPPGFVRSRLMVSGPSARPSQLTGTVNVLSPLSPAAQWSVPLVAS